MVIHSRKSCTKVTIFNSQCKSIIYVTITKSTANCVRYCIFYLFYKTRQYPNIVKNLNDNFFFINSLYSPNNEKFDTDKNNRCFM